MTFLWPRLLWLLVLLPIVVGIYVLVLRRRRRSVTAFPGLAATPEAAGSGPRLRRVLPVALIVVALALMIVAIARPAAVISVPSRHDAIVLAVDISGSMRATDMKPTRIAAAQEAARAFVADVPRSTRIGVVSFAGAASIVQYPTLSRDNVRSAIDRFALQPGTAIGSAILVSLKAIFPDLQVDLLGLSQRRDAARRERPKDDKADRDGKAEAKEPPAEPGSFGSAVIVLLTDGQSTTGPDPMEAARIAAEKGVRVYAVGIGTPAGEKLTIDGWTMRVRLDDAALKSIAATTRGEYLQAGTATELRKVYEALSARLAYERRETEVTGIVAAVAALFALAGAALSLWWFNRVL